MGDHFGNQRGIRIDGSVEDSVILLNQFSCVGFRIFNKLKINSGT